MSPSHIYIFPDTKASPGRTDSRATMTGILELSVNEPVDLRFVGEAMSDKKRSFYTSEGFGMIDHNLIVQFN